MAITGWSFLEDLLNIYDYLVKNLYATQTFYEYISANHSFFSKLNKPSPLDPSIRVEFKKDYDMDYNSKITNPQQSGSQHNEYDDESNIISLKESGVDEIEDDDEIDNKYNEALVFKHFDFLFMKEKSILSLNSS
jgi:hypothetical protein